VRVREEGQTDRKAHWVLLAGIFLVSFSLLAFEVALTRLLSVMLHYHYVFIVVSLALLGLGAGGIFVHLFRRDVSAGLAQFGALAWYASLIALSIVLSVILMIGINYIGFLKGNLVAYCILLFVPFFFTGILLAQVFRAFPAFSARIYGADLVGAALGSLGVILFLDSLGGINTVFVLGVIVSVAALLFALKPTKQDPRRMITALVSFLITISLLGVNLFSAYLPEIPIAGINPDKEMSLALNEPSYQADIIESRWSAFGRTDLVEFKQRPEMMRLYIDGTAGTPMYQFNGNLSAPGDEIKRLQETFSGYFPFFFLSSTERNNALAIGPGGGRDVLLALMGRVAKITAVEVNRDIVEIVRDYSWYNGDIFTKSENVNVVIDEGRNFLKRQKEKYDLIILSLPVTQTSRSLEGFALTENFLFTTQSMHDYLEHLTDEGQLVVVSHDDFTIWKLLAITFAALSERGVSQETAMSQIYLLGLSSPGVYPLFVLKKTPFTPAEATVRYEKMRQLGYNPALAYFPQIKGEGVVNQLLSDLSRGRITFNEVKKNLARNLSIDVSSATDNSPFFYKIELGLPPSVSLVLRLSLLAMVLILLVPILFRRQSPSAKTSRPVKRRASALPYSVVVLFSMIGIGFMLIEISLIQKFTLFLGQPILSLAVVLFSLLVGSGLGSLYSGRVTPDGMGKRIVVTTLVIFLVTGIYAFLLSFLFERLLGLALTPRLLITVILLLPLGFLMGHPFPLGMRWLKETQAENYIPWLWGLNGIGSVLGSVGTIAIAISLGFTQALLAGATCYLLASLVFRNTWLKQSSDSR